MTKQTKQQSDWEKDFESLWESSFDRDGNKEPFEFERLKDFISARIQKERNKCLKEYSSDCSQILREAKQKWAEEIEKDKHTAKRCLNFKGFDCSNKDCLNESCPLKQKLKEENN